MKVETLKHLSVTKLAVVCCNDSGFQNDTICDLIVRYCQKPNAAYQYTHACIMAEYSKFENVPEILTKRYELPECLSKEVVSSMKTITRNILQWCLYHLAKFNLPLDYVVHFLNESLFNSEGDILYTKATKKMVGDESLGLHQRFTVACGCLMTDRIGDMWLQLSTEERETIFITEKQDYDLNNGSRRPNEGCIQQSRLPRLWACYLRGRLWELPFWQGTGGQSLEEAVWRHAVEQAVADYNPTAIRFAWQDHHIAGKERVAVDLCLKMCERLRERNISRSFEGEKLVDILCFLMSNMSEDVKKEFLKEDLRKFEYSSVLLNLLLCDKGDVFLKTIVVMWDFLPLKEYDHRLLQMNTTGHNAKMFNDVWNVSPGHFKKYALNEGVFIHYRLRNDCDRFTIQNTVEMLSAEERFSVVFSKFKGFQNHESGLFVIAFAAGLLDLAQSLAKACELNEIDLKQWIKKELNYFVNELNFKIVTKRDMVFKERRCFSVYKVNWMEDRWQKVLCILQKVLCILQTAKGLQQYDDFFVWCFTSQEDIIDFKKMIFIHLSSTDIFYEITFGSCGFNDEDDFDAKRKDFAAYFLQYFDVRGSQLHALYKRTMKYFLKSYAMTCLISDVPKGQQFNRYESRLRKVMAVIEWYLIDKELVFEIRDIVRNELDQKKDDERVDTVRKDFELAFDKRLKELDGDN